MKLLRGEVFSRRAASRARGSGLEGGSRPLPASASRLRRTGVRRARGGVLIADEVGLGNTFIAGELIRQAVEERRQRVLVIAPATLRDGPWKNILDQYQLGVQCISFDELADDRQLNPEGTADHLRLNVFRVKKMRHEPAFRSGESDTHRGLAR